jgi:molybdate transport system regulatory protein
VALLEAIGETGSIAAAGRCMGMSYRRAWLLARMMNACFREPLIDAIKGGLGGGGTRLTAMGREALSLYRTMEDHATTAVIGEHGKAPRPDGRGTAGRLTAHHRDMQQIPYRGS